MALQLILGSSGYGKSTYLYNHIIKESINNPDINYMVIVPEQFTMQTQRDIVLMHPNGGTMNIDILSFNRLSYRIFDELGIVPKKVLEDFGKNMIIRKLASDNRDKLTIYKSSLDKPGFIEEVKSIMSELFQYDIDGNKFQQMIDSIDNKSVLNMKLNDIKILYDQFKTYTEDQYVVAEQLLDLLGECIIDSNIIANSVICFDGFTGFTPIQYKLIEKLLTFSRELIVTVTIDAAVASFTQSKEYELFYLSKNTILELKGIADNNRIKIKKDIILGDKKDNIYGFRFEKSKALEHLEKNLFRYPFKIYSENTNEIQLALLSNQRAEAYYISRKVKELVREGYRYRDIAIVSGNLLQSRKYFEEALIAYDIPFFIDANESIKNNPCVEAIKAVLEMISYDFTYETVFRYLKIGMSDLSVSEIELLENYIIGNGIYGFSSWKKPFKRKLKLMDEEALEKINIIREKFIEEIKDLAVAINKKNGNVRFRIEGIYNFIDRLNYYDKIAIIQKKFENENNYIQSKAYSQIYGKLLELFDKIVEIIGEEIISSKDLIGILDTGLEQLTLGILPPGLDQVVVGDIERTRLNHVKILFFSGVNDGIVPKANGNSGLLSDSEREKIIKSNITLAPTCKQKAYIEQFYLYLNLTKPSDRLYITYGRLSNDGGSIRPSYLIHRITTIFSGVKVKEIKSDDFYEGNIYSINSGTDYLIYCYKEYLCGNEISGFRELLEVFSEDENGRKIINMIEKGLMYSNNETNLSAAVARALYGYNINNSVSRLEKFASCAYAHFLNYGLRLAQREEYKIRAMDIGNVFHKTMEIFAKSINESGISWNGISDEKREQLVEDAVNSVVEQEEYSIFNSNSRNHYMINTIMRIAKRTAWAVTEQISLGDMKPSFFEMKFGNNDSIKNTKISLKDNVSMRLNGIIDRIDTYEDDDNIYLKIIDYKSGQKDFNIIDLYSGIQIQLVVYMNAAMEMINNQMAKNDNKNIVPAGMFYYKINDPVIALEEGKNIDVNREILKELKPDGLVNEEHQCINIMEKNLEGIAIPVSYSKSGKMDARSKTATSKEFDSIGEFVNLKIKELGNKMIEGEIGINPINDGKNTACDYCQYRTVCKFDNKNGDNRYNYINQLDKEEIWDIITKKGGEAVEE